MISFSEKVKVSQMELFLDINFDKKILKGRVHLKCEKQKSVVTSHLVSSTDNYL